jgi:hypothetical protein
MLFAGGIVLLALLGLLALDTGHSSRAGADLALHNTD